MAAGHAVGRVRVAVLGAGGLGKAAARIIGMKRELCLAAMCDSRGLVASEAGLDGERFAAISGDLVEGARAMQEDGPASSGGVSVATAVEARHCEDPLGEILGFAGLKYDKSA